MVGASACACYVIDALVTDIGERFPLLVNQLHINAQVFTPQRDGGNRQLLVRIGGVIQQVRG